MREAAIIHWDLSITFKTKAQAVAFIRILTSEEIDFNFSYHMELTATSSVYIITIEDMPWAQNLTTIAGILELVDADA